MIPFLSKLFNRKASNVKPLIVFSSAGKPKETPRNYKNFSDEAYRKNVIVFRSVSLISDAVARLPWVLFRKQRNKKPIEVEEHRLLSLLENPNPMQPKQSFLKSLAGFYIIAGNSYIEAVGPRNADAPGPNALPRELWILRPDRMKVIPGPTAMPMGYRYEVDGRKRDILVTSNGRSAIKHIKTFNPVDDFYGMSPIEAASRDIDVLNEMGMWNLSLMQNRARPDGAFVVNPDVSLTEEQRRSMKEEIKKEVSGRGVGNPLLLEGGAEWKDMSLSPKEMDFLQSKNMGEKDVALAFGVPGQLIGVEGSQTFANYQQARLAFYQDTVLPVAETIRDCLNGWLSPIFDKSLFLDFDRDSIEALAPLREKVWNQAQSATWLSINEKRELTGYGAHEPSGDPADDIFVGAGQIPLSVASEPLNPPQPQPTDEGSGNGADQPGTADNRVIAYIDGKQFNLRTNAQKRRFWATQERKRAAFERKLRDDLKNHFDTEGKKIEERIDSMDLRLIEMNINDVLSENQENLESILKENVKRTMEGFGRDVLDLGKSMEDMETKQTEEAEQTFEAFMARYINDELGDKIKTIAESSKRIVLKKIKKIFNEAVEAGEPLTKIRDEIEKTYSGFNRSRSAAIAKTETHTAANVSSRNAAKSLGRKNMKKEWISDLRPGAELRDNHVAMNGTKVNIEEKFSVPNPQSGADTLMEGPGDPNAPASQVVNCLCTQVYASEQSD